MAFQGIRPVSRLFSCSLRHGLKGITRNASSNPAEQSQSVIQYLLFAIPASAFGLGTWQVYRLQWKRNLIAEMEKRTTQEPVELFEVIDHIDDESLQYRKVRVKGTFDHSQEMYITPRSNLNKQDRRGGGFGQRADTGAHVFTPLKLANTSESIMVNRGFVTRKKIKPETRMAGQVDGEVEFTALVRKPEQRPVFVPESAPERNSWKYRDVRMCQMAGTLPVFVDADAASTVEGGPLGGQTQVNIRNEHLQYIITWYALAGFTGYMFYKMRQKPANPFSASGLRS